MTPVKTQAVPLPEPVEGSGRFDKLTVRFLGWLFLLLPTFELAAASKELCYALAS